MNNNLHCKLKVIIVVWIFFLFRIKVIRPSTIIYLFFFLHLPKLLKKKPKELKFSTKNKVSPNVRSNVQSSSNRKREEIFTLQMSKYSFGFSLSNNCLM